MNVGKSARGRLRIELRDLRLILFASTRFLAIATTSITTALALAASGWAQADSTATESHALKQTLAQVPTSPSSAPSNNEPLIPVKRIEITGSTVFGEAQFGPLVAPLQNRSVTLAQLRELADKITQLYLDNNYITSRAILPADQDINDGEIVIRVLEGSLERIEIRRGGDVSGRLSDSYIRDRVAQGVGVPLNFARIEDELQLLRADPLVSDLRASLAAGSEAGRSVLQITFSEASTFSINPFSDNYGNPATGIYRGGITLQQLNLTGIGDRISGNYTRSGSADSFGGSYQFPLNPKGGTLDLNFSLGTNPIVEPPFDTLNIKTDSQIYELTYRQPLERSPRSEFALSLGVAIEQSSTFLDGRSFNFQTSEFDDGLSKSSVLRFGQDLISRDPGGAWAARSLFSFGLNAFGATSRTNAPDANFFYWTGQLLRVQRLGADRDTLALLRASVQLAGDDLLPLNRFSIGGPQSIRGYRQNQVTGDNGVQGSVELQLPIIRDGDGVSLIKLLPFFDVGSVWNSKVSNPPNQTLAGVGLGLLWQPGRSFSLRLDYGIPLIKVNNTNNTLQDAGLYFSINGSL